MLLRKRLFIFSIVIPLQGIKSRDYLDFVKLAKIIEAKGHLSQ